jgi:hypothetical protein
MGRFRVRTNQIKSNLRPKVVTSEPMVGLLRQQGKVPGRLNPMSRKRLCNFLISSQALPNLIITVTFSTLGYRNDRS